MRKPGFAFPTRSDINLTLQPQKMARGLQFWNQEEDGLYYPCSESKGADQLHSYSEAALHLCFCIHAKSWFSHDTDDSSYNIWS